MKSDKFRTLLLKIKKISIKVQKEITNRLVAKVLSLFVLFVIFLTCEYRFSSVESLEENNSHKLVGEGHLRYR